MKSHIKQVERLNSVFSEVIAHIYLSPYSNDTFNNMSGAQKKILFGLSKAGAQKMGDVARQISVTMSGATGIVDRLVKVGLVQRCADPDDRRITLIDLTDKGRKSVQELTSIHERRLQEVLEGLPAGQRVELVAAFERIHQILMKLPLISERTGGAQT